MTGPSTTERSTDLGRAGAARDGGTPGGAAWSPLFNPGLIALLAACVPLALIASTPENTFQLVTGVAQPSSRFLIELTIICGAGLIGFLLSLGVRKAAPAATVTPPHEQIERLRRRASILAAICCLAYAVYGALAVARGLSPAMVASVLNGQPEALRLSRIAFAPVAGVTTLVAVGGVAVAALIMTRVEVGLRGAHWAAIAVIVAGATARSFLNAERLALMEVVVPMGLALFALRRVKAGRQDRRVSSAPVVLAIGAGVVAVFALGELLRPSYQVREGKVEFGSYVYGRLFGYYLSSTTNGEYLQALTQVVPTPFLTAQAFWTFPGVSMLVMPEKAFGYDPGLAFTTALAQRANPELNTVGLAPALLAEWGLAVAAVLFLAIVLALSTAWRRFLHRLDPPFVPLVAVLVVAAAESARYPYFCQGRFVVAVAGALWVAQAVPRR